MFNTQDTKKILTQVFIAIALLSIAYIQTYSLWLPIGEKVDESELVYYAVGFFGNDFDPHWYGYGNFGMYLLYLWYMLIYAFQFLSGNIENINDYAQQLFYTEFFINAGRYLFALLGVLTIAIYTLILHKKFELKAAWIFFILSVFSAETIFFANYIRTDQLVSFLIACLMYCFLFFEGKKKLYYIAFITAALITTKISSLFIGAIFAFSLIYSYSIKKQLKIKEVIQIILFFILLIVLFQPYSNPLFVLINTFNNNALNVDPVMDKLSMVEKWQSVFNYIQINVYNRVSHILLYLLPLVIFIQKKYRTLVFITLSIITLILLPFFTGNGIIRYYWLNPIYDLVRLLGFISLFNLIEVALKYFSFKNKDKLAIITLLIFISLPVYNSANNYLHILAINENVSNKKQAEKWIKNNLIGKHDILVDGYYNYVLPRVYDPSFLQKSKSISRIFIFNRSKNKYLNEQFENFLLHKYLNEDKVNYKKLRAFRIDPVEKKSPDLLISNLSVQYKDTEIPTKFVRAKQINNKNLLSNNTIKFDSIGNDPYIVYQLKEHVVADGNLNISFSTENILDTVGLIYFDTGNGFNKNEKTQYVNNHNISKDITLYQSINQLQKIYAFDVNNTEKTLNTHGKYFITSPVIYNRIMNKSNIKSGHKYHSINKNLMTDYYRFMLKNEPVKTFREGKGRQIEIYKL